MFKYLLALAIVIGISPVAHTKTVGAKAHYLCLAAQINKHLKELQPIYYGKEEQLEAVYCISVKGDYIVLKDGRANLTVFKDVEIVDNLIVGKTNEREIIVQPQTDKYKLDNEYARFIYSEVAKHRKQLLPEPIVPEDTNAGSANYSSNRTPGEVYAD